MNKLLGLFLLALAFMAPGTANAVACFWVGGTGTWDASSITNWGPTSGGAATGCNISNAAPAAGDTVTFDANSGTGTITPTTAINGIAFGALTAGALTGGSTLAFNTNNPNLSFTSVNFSGSGTRTINMGTGAWTVTGNAGTVWDCSTTTNLTPTFSNASVTFTGSTANKAVTVGTPSGGYGAVTFASNATKGFVFLTAGGATFASLTVNDGNTITLTQSATTTVTGALTMTGTASAPVGLQSSLPSSNIGTISVGSSSTIVWGAILRVTKSGAGSITATNSFDLGGNTSVTITPPSAGGGGGGRIIGG